MGKIVLLDELTINQIAAGEVIERPASVIKEMIENSIDAGASHITVEIKNGGISYIRVTDDGKGIEKDDLEIAFERHATSKIRSADDLDTVTSMGFRGEALASIAAIANVELVSKTEEQDTGYKVVVEAGEILEKEEVGCPKGTTITVKNLFFNTPVRYKFLKKDYTESGYIEDVITRIALVNPHISFKLINTDKTIIQTTGNGEMKSVIYSIYGKEIAEGILETEYQYEGIQINGVVGKPEIARSNRSRQLFFVNERYIKDKTVSSAADKAFKGMLPIGKFGFLVLNIKIDPSKVDVNVHPAKLEVRFEEEGKIFKAVYHAIQDTLLKGDLIANTEKVEENVTDKKESFEEILGKQNTVKGFLFGKNRKSNDKDSKTENMEATQVFSKIEETKKETDVNARGPISTEDILKQLKDMRDNLEREVAENENLSLNDSYIKGEIPQLEKQEEVVEEKTDENIDTETIVKEEANADELLEDNSENNLQENIEEQQEKSIEENAEEKVEETLEQQERTDKEELLEQIKEKIEGLENNTQPVYGDFDEMYAKMFGKIPEKREEKEEVVEASDIIKEENISVFEDIEEYKKPTYKFIGIAFNTYIILEIEKEMYILDQHAAHERIMYEKVKKNYYNEEEKHSQLLLLPDIITLTHKEMDIARENMEMFEKAGFMLEEFGENTIKLSGVPEFCFDLETKEMFLETLDEINTVARTAKQEIEEKFIATVACKAAVKANMALSNEEVDSLMQQLLQLPNPFTCPHGRPTAIKMTKYDIEKKFSRR